MALMLFSQSVLSAPAPAGGDLLQQIPAAVSPAKAPPPIQVETGPQRATQDADTSAFTVTQLRIRGSRVYTEAELLAITPFRPGAVMTLAGLRDLAANIAAYYHQQGFFVAQAYLPAQDIRDGVVTIMVIDGQLGNVTVRNQSTLPDAMLVAMLDGLNRGDVIRTAALEDKLLALADIPGVIIRANMVPGAAAGTSDLQLDVSPGAAVSGSLDIDNAGNRYTGELRLGATVNLNNPTGRGDLASLRALTSFSGLNYMRVQYQTPFGKATVGASYSFLQYELGREFESLQANGTAKVAGLFANYPLHRSRGGHLRVALGYDAKWFKDRIDVAATVTDKATDVMTAGLVGGSIDMLGGGGVNTVALTWSGGSLDIRSQPDRTLDALSTRSNGNFAKLTLAATRLQHISPSLSLYGALRGQLASKNLDISEKMGFGGLYGVRAYPEGEAYADEGYLLTLEARLRLQAFAVPRPDPLQLVAFADIGSVAANHSPWQAGANRRHLTGAGLGVQWSHEPNLTVKAFYAIKLSDEASTSGPDLPGRLWVQAVQYF